MIGIKIHYFISCLIFISAQFVNATEIVFIPGWNSEKEDKATYETPLKELFPGTKINIMTWKSDIMDWTKVLENADVFSTDVTKYIESLSQEEQTNLILIGHSLGCRIIANVTKELYDKHIRIRQIALLGAAIDYDVDLEPLTKTSMTPVISVFSRNDSVLKYLYSNMQHKFALGFCGAERIPSENFIQYSFATSESIVANTQLDSALKEANNHFATVYLNELKEIKNGNNKPFKPKYDYSEITIEKGALSIPNDWVIPPIIKMDVLDSYADWLFVKTEIPFKIKEKYGIRIEHKQPVYFIVDQFGRIALWNLLKTPLEKRFQEIRNKIKVLDISQ